MNIVQSVRIAQCVLAILATSSVRLYAQAPVASAAVAVAPTDRKDPRLVLAIEEFQARWQADWRFSDQSRQSPLDLRDRHKFFHCHVELFKDPRTAPDPYKMIPSQFSAFGVCPTWLLGSDVVDATDESGGRDGALLARLRPGVARARDELIQQLSAAFAAEPSNDWLTGQLVRLLIDQRQFAQAQTVARTCAATPWRCAALQGLTLARAGNALDADSAFMRMRRLMPEEVRERWQDLTQWLPASEIPQYTRTPSASRDTVYWRLWWLADPLYRIAGNARRVEQDARQTDVMIRTSMTQDERYSYDTVRGGDALATTLLRYGWPSYTAWSGTDEEFTHSHYLEDTHHSPIAPPYTTFEYTEDRVHTLPSPRALASPFKATSSDWNLAPLEATVGPATNWWPIEHFRHTRRLLQLPDGQTVTIRRQSHVDVVSALTLPRPTLGSSSTSVDVMMLAAHSPEHVDSIDRRVGLEGTAIVLRGPIASSPTLLAIEALGDKATSVDARTRFGFVPPAPLSEMRAGEIALSDLAVLRRLDSDRIREPTDSLLDALLPEKSLAPSTRALTLYWESYGVSAKDSASSVVRIASEDAPGLLQRIGIATRLVNDPTREVIIRWKDAESMARTTTLPGPVPVQMRALTLDLTSLRPGRYTVEVAILLPDARNAISRTSIELRP